MLDLIKKIHSRDGNFSAKELSLIVRHFHSLRYFAETQQIDMLDRIWPLIPEKNRVHEVTSAFYGVFYNISKIPDQGAFKWILNKIEEISDPDFLGGLFDGEYHDELGEAFGYILKSGSTELVDQFLEFALRVRGDDGLKAIIDVCGLDLAHIHIIDKFIDLARQLGGDDLVRYMFKSSGLSLSRIIDDDYFYPNRDYNERRDAAIYFLRKQYEFGGTEAIVDSYQSLFEDMTEDRVDEYKDILVPVLQSLIDIGGNELIKAVFGHDDFSILYAIIGPSSIHEVMDAIEQLAAETQDREFTENVRLSLELGWELEVTFVTAAEIVLENLKKGIYEEDKERLELDLKWAYTRVPAPRFKEPGDIDSRSMAFVAMFKMVTKNDLEEFQLAIELEGALGLPNPIDNLLTFFPLIASVSNNPDILKLFLEYAHTEHGDDYTKQILAGSAGEEPFAHLIAANSVASIDICLDMARKIGGEFFVNKLLRGHKGDYSVLRNGSTENLMHILPLISPLDRGIVYRHLHPDWQRLEEKRISKTAFFQNHSDGAFRWRGITGGTPPYGSFHQHGSNYKQDEWMEMARHYFDKKSPYRFKPNLYARLAPLLETTADLEKGNHASEERAYNFSVLFSNEQEINSYLTKCRTVWMQDSQDIICEAGSFELPEKGEWDTKRWSALVMRYGPAVYPYLKHADIIESKADHFPTSLSDLRAILPELSYERREENPELARLSIQYGLRKRKFDQVLDFVKQHGKNDDHIPAIFIDGEKIGHENFYLSRLAPNDLMGLFLGYELAQDHGFKCCQSVGDNGEACALYGMSSPYSAFYVWREKTLGEITENDKIVAESWVWIGDDNNIVFDSFEMKHASHRKLVQPFLEQFAFELRGCYFIDGSEEKVFTGVRLGCDDTGQTPKLALVNTETPSQPIDYKGFYASDDTPARDSHAQYVIEPIDHSTPSQKPADEPGPDVPTYIVPQPRGAANELA